jgi:hypothetical protein
MSRSSNATLPPRYRVVLERRFEALLPVLEHSTAAMPLSFIYGALCELGGERRAVALHELVAYCAQYSTYADEAPLVVARTLRRLWLRGLVARTEARTPRV